MTCISAIFLSQNSIHRHMSICVCVSVCGYVTASHTPPSTYSPCPSICIFKYTRKSRSITDANKLNERRKIHKYKVPTVCFHLNWNWSLRTASQQLQHELESRASASTSTSTSAPQTNKGSQQEKEKEQQEEQPTAREQAPAEGQKTPVPSQDADSLQTQTSLWSRWRRRQSRPRRFSLFCFAVILALWKLHYKQRQQK